ncbi:Nn.00g065660.m01.CDS01 [Neocucurbitaria sp. VM-36]
MGGRLSMPKGADGMSETSKPTSANAAARLTRNKGIINGRTVMAPLAALTMAGLLFVYARTSIRAAKLNAQKHREADGGQISWHKESMRRHGHLDKVEDDRGTLKEALMGDIRKKNKTNGGESEKAPLERSDNDQELRKIMGKKD